MIEVNISNDGPSQIILNWEESDHPQFQGVYLSAVPSLPSGATTNFSKGTTNTTINFPKGSLVSNRYTLTLTTSYQNLPPKTNTLDPVEIYDYQWEVAEYDNSKTSYDSLFDFASGYVDDKVISLSLSEGFTLGQWLTGPSGARVRATNFSYDAVLDTLTVQAESEQNGSSLPIAWQIGLSDEPVTSDITLINDSLPGVKISSGYRDTLIISNYQSIGARYNRYVKYRIGVLGLGAVPAEQYIHYNVGLVSQSRNSQAVSFSNSFSSTGVQIETNSGMLRPSGNPSGDQNQRLDFEGTNVHQLLIHRLLDGAVDDSFYIKVNVTDVDGQ